MAAPEEQLPGIDHLNFEFTEHDPMGPQEFADRHSMAAEGAAIVYTETIHHDPVNTFVVLGFTAGERSRMIPPRTGTRVIRAVEGLGTVRVADVIQQPAVGRPGLVVETDLIRVDGVLRVHETREYEFGPGTYFQMPIPVAGLAKVVQGYDRMAIGYPDLAERVAALSPQQCLEYRLPHDVHHATSRHQAA